MSNKILNLKKLSNSSDIQISKITKSTEIYTDISLKSKYVVGKKGTTLSTDFLAEEFYDDNIFLTERDREKMRIVSDDTQQITYLDDINGFKVSKSINVLAVQNAIENIFSFIPGERILYPEFGSVIRKYLYEGITIHNVEKLIAEINAAFLKFDPRVIVDNIQDVSDISDTDDNTVVLKITYHIKNLPLQYYTYEYSYVRPID